MIAAVTAMTITGTVDVFRGQTRQSPVDRWMVSVWSHVRQETMPTLSTWVSDIQTSNGSQNTVEPSPGQPGPQRVARPELDEQVKRGQQRARSDSGSASASKPANKAPAPPALSATDATRMKDIGDALVQNLTPLEWKQIVSALSSGQPSATADKTVVQVLRSHLPAEDLTWLQQRFQVDLNASQKDIAILQRSVTQAESELTPGERKILEGELQTQQTKPQTQTRPSNGAEPGNVH